MPYWAFRSCREFLWHSFHSLRRRRLWYLPTENRAKSPLSTPRRTPTKLPFDRSDSADDIECRNERMITDTHPVDLQCTAGDGKCRHPGRRLHWWRHIQRHAASTLPRPVTLVHCESFNTNSTVRVFSFKVCFSYSRNRRTITVEVLGEMLDGSQLRQRSSVEQVYRRCGCRRDAFAHMRNRNLYLDCI